MDFNSKKIGQMIIASKMCEKSFNKGLKKVAAAIESGTYRTFSTALIFLGSVLSYPFFFLSFLELDLRQRKIPIPFTFSHKLGDLIHSSNGLRDNENPFPLPFEV